MGSWRGYWKGHWLDSLEQKLGIDWENRWEMMRESLSEKRMVREKENWLERKKEPSKENHLVLWLEKKKEILMDDPQGN